MSTNQSIYQQPPSVAKQDNIISRPTNNVSPGFTRSRKINSTIPNPAFTGKAQAPSVSPAPPPYKSNLQEEEKEEKEKTKIFKEAIKDKEKAEITSAIFAGSGKIAIIAAAVILIIAGIVLLWAFYISKTRSGKDALTSCDAGSNMANSSGDSAKSSKS